MDHHSNLKKKTVKSIFSLFFQSGYSAFLGLLANLILTIVVSPKIFGVYITLLSTISFLNYFSDIGLAASLIQKKEVDDEDIKTVFTVQQTLIITLVVIGILTSSFVTSFYHLPKDGTYLYLALLVSFFISSLKTIPSVFLERKVEYEKIVFVQIVENTFFYLLVIIFALLRFELKSFIIAVIFRSLTGLFLIYKLSPWKISIGFNKNRFSQLISFGLPFQSSSFLALFKDDLIILYLGKVVGFEGVGYIGWAKKWAEAPIRIIMDNVTKVLFPAISRIQDNKEKVGQLIEKVLYYLTGLIAPIMVFVYFLMPYLLKIIPRYQKWQKALPLFNIFLLSSFLVIYYAPFINIFNALGKVKKSLSFMLFWTVFMWFLTPILTKIFGYFGFPITHLFISLTFPLVVLSMKKEFLFNFFKPIKPFIISSFLTFFTLLFFEKFFISSNLYLDFLNNIILGFFIYFASLFLIFKIKPIGELKRLFI
jgi:Membrane protein involved in the export of O-antigen and teichoic acid